MKKVNSHICKMTIICVSPILSVHEDTFAFCGVHSMDKCLSFFLYRIIKNVVYIFKMSD